MAGKSGHLECSDPRQLPGAELTLGPPDVPVVSSVVPTPPTHAPSWTPLLQLCLCSGFAVPSGCSSSSSIVFINQEAWMSGSRKSKVSLSCTACMCVCERERENEWLKPTELHTFTQPSSHANFHLETILPACSVPGASALSTGNEQRGVTEFSS